MIKKIIITVVLFFMGVPVWAGSYDDILKRYPPGSYLVGIAEVSSSQDPYRDRRRAEILARLEIAKQIRVRIKSATIDVVCEGEGGAVIFTGAGECKSQFAMIIEETVDEVLEGSRIVDAGEDRDRGIYYAVAVLPKKDEVRKAKKRMEESLERAEEALRKAKKSKEAEEKKEHIERAKEELLRGMAYDGERRALEDTRENARDMFRQMTEEIEKLKEGI